MGAVVYATIGRISRMPNFGAASDYDFDNPETYGGSGGIYSYFGGSGSEGNTAFHGDSYALSDAQLNTWRPCAWASRGAALPTR